MSKNPKLLGLIAGNGDFPRLLARAASDQGYSVEAFGINSLTSPELAGEVAQVHWLHLGQFGRMIDICHERGIERLAMAGRVPHTAIFKYRGFDKRSLAILGKMTNWKTDSILGAVTAELAREHIEVIDSTLFLRSLMPKRGVLAKRRPTRAESDAIRFGLNLAKEIGRLDIGQSVAVKERVVVAVESIEGTDEMIRRAGTLVEGGFIVCKVAKPMQDQRFDVPVLGSNTIRTMVEAGATALAFEAGATLFFDLDEAVALADRHKIAIVAQAFRE